MTDLDRVILERREQRRLYLATKRRLERESREKEARVTLLEKLQSFIAPLNPLKRA